jgi:hypothetical protein
MILETLAVMALLFGAIACVSWDEITGWIRRRSPIASADLIKTALANGDVQIVAVGLDSVGATTASKTWRAKSLDARLGATFGSASRIRVTV